MSVFRWDLKKAFPSFDASTVPTLSLSTGVNTSQIGPTETLTTTLSTKPSFFSNNVSFSSSTPTTSFDSASPSFFSTDVTFSPSVNIPSQSIDNKSNAVNEVSPLTPEEKLDVASGLEQQTLEDFSNLLSRLEASKMKQERKKAVETRQDTMAKGLASMLGNF